MALKQDAWQLQRNNLQQICDLIGNPVYNVFIESLSAAWTKQTWRKHLRWRNMRFSSCCSAAYVVLYETTCRKMQRNFSRCNIMIIIPFVHINQNNLSGNQFPPTGYNKLYSISRSPEQLLWLGGLRREVLSVAGLTAHNIVTRAKRCWLIQLGLSGPLSDEEWVCKPRSVYVCSSSISRWVKPAVWFGWTSLQHWDSHSFS